MSVRGTPRAMAFWIVAVWLVGGLFIHAFAVPLDSISILGMPVGYLFAAQGSLVIGIALLFWFSVRSDALESD